MRGNLQELRARLRMALDLEPEPARETPRWAISDLLEQASTGNCYFCDSRATLQLHPGCPVLTAKTSQDAKYVHLCTTHLGDFIETWADPSVREWIINRL
ncbi:MAG: hypothetical protein LC687_07640 [Actinobacteria bacterium]|nr:hypothetical protein [Actinomycetota bacterium]